MPVIIRNKTNSIEIDIHANLKYEVSKGAFDVIYHDTGATPTTPAMVYVVLRSSAITENNIVLDYRDVTVMPGATSFASAEELRDTLLAWNIPLISISGAVDGTTGAIVTIPDSEHEINEGNAYSVADTVAANSTTVKWQIRTPNSLLYAHLIFSLTCTGEATFLVTEGSDRNDGTPLSSVNRRRIAPDAATVVVTRTPAGGSTDGTVILFSMRNGITGVAGKSVETGSARATNMWILKPNTKYVISITTYADVFATCQLDWNEHADL